MVFAEHELQGNKDRKAVRRRYENHLAKRWGKNPYVFFGRAHRAGKKRCGGENKFPVSAALNGWDEACKAAGLEGLTLHDLRRSAVRNMKRAGVVDSIAMSITGHKTRSMYDRYDIVDESDFQAAGQQLEEYAARQKKARAARLKLVK